MKDRCEQTLRFQHMLFYEIIPPAQEKADAERASYLAFLAEVGRRLPLDAVNIPEVRHEADRRGNRTVAFVAKEEPRSFALAVCRELGLPVVINRVVVHRPPAEQWDWFAETVTQYGIRDIVVVGGAASELRYPGPSVTETARYLSSRQEGRRLNVCPGGITIPSRRGEVQRLVAKARAGIQFFTSQVLYDAGPSQRLLAEYAAVCHEEGLAPRPILLSFAPVSRAKDLAFLRWLGVEIPGEARRQLTEAVDLAGASLDYQERLLAEILTYVERHDLGIPIGVNVAHIMSYNRELALELGERLAGLLARTQAWGDAARASQS